MKNSNYHEISNFTSGSLCASVEYFRYSNAEGNELKKYLKEWLFCFLLNKQNSFNSVHFQVRPDWIVWIQFTYSKGISSPIIVNKINSITIGGFLHDMYNAAIVVHNSGISSTLIIDFCCS